MKANLKKKILGLLITSSLGVFLSACGSEDIPSDILLSSELTIEQSAENINDTREINTASVEDTDEITSEEISEVEVSTESETPAKGQLKDVIAYGDTIYVSCIKTEHVEGMEIVQDLGKLFMVVDASAWEFQMGDFMYESEDDIMKNINKAIGKKAGDVFELKFEYGDGSVSYKYTILEITETPESVSNNRNIVQRGDIVAIDYEEYDVLNGVWCEDSSSPDLITVEISKDGTSFWNTYEYSDDTGLQESNLQKILGKETGDVFILNTSENIPRENVRYKITKILKTATNF